MGSTCRKFSVGLNTQSIALTVVVDYVIRRVPLQNSFAYRILVLHCDTPILHAMCSLEVAGGRLTWVRHERASSSSEASDVNDFHLH